jgi:glutathione S-transferase
VNIDELKPDGSRQVENWTLVLGQKNYSSWSMRAWLLLKTLGVHFTVMTVPLYGTDSRDTVRGLGGQTGLVPVLIDRGTPVWDTFAIFEHLYERYPAVWPTDRFDRARARSLSGELHSSFNDLRAAMPVNTRARGRHAKLTKEVSADIDRVVQIWSQQLGGTPWLFGSFSGADIMFAPIATRFQTYGVQLEGYAKSYMDRILAHPLVVEWLRLGSEEPDVIPVLEVGR